MRERRRRAGASRRAGRRAAARSAAAASAASRKRRRTVACDACAGAAAPLRSPRPARGRARTGAPRWNADLARRDGIARVGDDDVDRAGDRVAAHRDGEQPAQRPGGQPLDELRRRDDLTQERRLGPREVARRGPRASTAPRSTSAWTSGTPPVTDAKSASAIAAGEATSSSEERLRQLVGGHATNLPERGSQLGASAASLACRTGRRPRSCGRARAARARSARPPPGSRGAPSPRCGGARRRAGARRSRPRRPELLLERAHPRHALRLEDEHGHGDERDRQDGERQAAEPGRRTASSERSNGSPARRPMDKFRGEWKRYRGFRSGCATLSDVMSRGRPSSGSRCTRSSSRGRKLFCGCATSFGAPPNTHVCPMCLGLPGRAPVLNARGGADGGEGGARARLHDPARRASSRGRTTSTRTCRRATRSASSTSRSATRATSTSRSATATTRSRSARASRASTWRRTRARTSTTLGGGSVVDLNRAGTPLVEIVGEPDLAHARRGGRRTSARCATSSSSSASTTATSRRARSAATPTSRSARRATTKLGTRVELKNINSFRFVEKAIAGEIARQKEVLEARRPHRPGDARLGREDGHDVLAPQQGDGAGLPLLPEPDLPPLVLDDVFVATRARGARPSCRARSASASSPSSASRRTPRRCSRSIRASPRSSRRPRRSIGDAGARSRTSSRARSCATSRRTGSRRRSR